MALAWAALRSGALPIDDLGALAAVVLAFGGALASGLSWVLLLELSVGRIIRARNPSAGLESASLVRELGRSAAGCVGREGREDCRRTLAVVPLVVRVWPAPVALLRVEGFLVNVEVAVLVRPAGLDGP